MDAILHLLQSPASWAALATLVVLEVVLGIDNLIFISVLTNKLPEAQRKSARRIGIGLALGLRLVLLSTIAFIVGLTAPVFDLGLAGAPGAHGEASFETAFSWRDLILIAGGLFLVWKATKGNHHVVDPAPVTDLLNKHGKVAMSFGSAIVQILLLDMVFSIDSILTAVGMTDHVPIMIAAVIITVAIMLLAAEPVANFINRNPGVIILAHSFMLMIGIVLIADGFGFHVPKGYIYAAMAFSALVEGLNMLARARSNRKAANTRESHAGG